jgi:hypothetical protein
MYRQSAHSGEGERPILRKGRVRQADVDAIGAVPPTLTRCRHVAGLRRGIPILPCLSLLGLFL